MATIKAWTPTASTGMGGTTGGYFGGAFQKGGGNVPGSTCPNHTRDLAYWLEMARATGFWDLNNETRALALQVANEIWAHQNPNGSISVDYPSCGKTRDSGESDGLTLVAFDPRVPTWFSTISPIVTSSSTSSSSSTTSTATVVSRTTAAEALLPIVVAAIVVIAVVAGAVVFMITRRR